MQQSVKLRNGTHSQRTRKARGGGMTNVLAASKIEQISSLVIEGKSLRQIEALTGVAKKTVARYRRLVLQKALTILKCRCGEPIGHRGWCAARYAESPKRQSFVKDYWERYRVANPRRRKMPAVPRSPLLRYPYIPAAGTRCSGADLLMIVNDAVPRYIAEDVRADICQELLLSIVAGEFSLEEVSKFVRPIAKRVREQLWDFSAVSIDMKDGDGVPLAERIAAEITEEEQEDDFHAGEWLRVA